jgi:hypothetical protein
MLLLALAHLSLLSPFPQSAAGAPQGGDPRADSAAATQELPVFEVVPLANAEAGEVAGNLRNLLQGGARITPDARTNSLLLMGSENHLRDRRR